MNTLYPTVLGTDFQRLDPLLQQFHQAHDVVWHGHADVRWTDRPALRALLRLARLPAEGRAVPLQVRVLHGGNKEVWQRRFASRTMASRQYRKASRVQEAFGPIRLSLDSRIQGAGLIQHSVRSHYLGIPLPGWCALQVSAHEWQEAGLFHFDVAIRFGPWTLIGYTGCLRPDAP
ncbi:DUF4166 domain-containing protein [Jeongeupia wiesaeckerbachi]|uniref:DUF4166 domain-containing protein n=1 Tax=Jeongeupia wiesaeckerbachi TaxID=3051218 RepID=UPI003D8040D5